MKQAANPHTGEDGTIQSLTFLHESKKLRMFNTRSIPLHLISVLVLVYQCFLALLVFKWIWIT